jgi:hypothetical protein
MEAFPNNKGPAKSIFPRILHRFRVTGCIIPPKGNYPDRTQTDKMAVFRKMVTGRAKTPERFAAHRNRNPSFFGFLLDQGFMKRNAKVPLLF